MPLDISALPAPEIIEELSYEQIMAEQTETLQGFIPGYTPLESDDYMLILQAFAYREMLLRARINNAIKGVLPAFAAGADLDHIAVGYGVSRLEGSRPYAEFNFTLAAPLSTPITLPIGLLLQSADGIYSARLLEYVVIPAGETLGTGTVELEAFVDESDAKIDQIATSLPWVVSAEALGIFKNGAELESDADFLERILLSLERFSTAGSPGSYRYHALSADKRISDVSVISPSDGVVEVYLCAKEGVDAEMIARVDTVLNDERVRPLTDHPAVLAAETVVVNITATVELFDLGQSGEIDALIRTALFKTFSIGEDLTHSQIIRALHQNGVYRVTLAEPTEDVITDATQVIAIGVLNLSYTAAAI